MTASCGTDEKHRVGLSCSKEVTGARLKTDKNKNKPGASEVGQRVKILPGLA